MPLPALAAVPALVALLMQGLRWLFMSRLGLFIASAFAWLGINLGSVKLVLEPTLNLLRGYAQGLGSGGEMFLTAQQWAGVLNFDRAITMVISAYVAKWALAQGRLFLFRRGTGA